MIEMLLDILMFRFTRYKPLDYCLGLMIWIYMVALLSLVLNLR